MTADTCTTYVIPAIEKGFNYTRSVWIVQDSDGHWYKVYKYEGEIKSELIKHI